MIARLSLAAQAAACALLLATGAAAQATGHVPPSEAMTLFESAREHYRAGRYPEAAEALERALVLDPSAPTLLFNLGRVYELMGDYDHAISALERLVAVTPAGPERTEAETTLGRLRGAAEHATPPPSVEEVGSMDEGPTFVRERGVADAAFWGTMAAGAVITLVAAGLGIGALVVDAEVDGWVLDGTHSIDGRQAAYGTAEALAIAGDVLGGIGGATLLSAVVLFVAREHTYEIWPERDATSLRIDVGPGHAGVVVGGTF